MSLLDLWAFVLCGDAVFVTHQVNSIDAGQWRREVCKVEEMQPVRGI